MGLLLRFGPRELEAPATLFERSGSILLPWRTGGWAFCCVSVLASWKLPLLCLNVVGASCSRGGLEDALVAAFRSSRAGSSRYFV